MEFLKRLGSDPEFVDYYDHEEYEEALKAELYNKGLEAGEVKGHASGLAEGQSNIIKSMVASNFSVEEISKIINIPLEEVKKLMNRN